MENKKLVAERNNFEKECNSTPLSEEKQLDGCGVWYCFFIHRRVKMRYRARDEQHKGSAQAEPSNGSVARSASKGKL